MTTIYDIIAKRHRGCSRTDVILFCDENRETAIEFMSKYNKKHGFKIDDSDGTFTIANLVLREREATGKRLRETSYIELFDAFGNRLIKS